jgi:hypothetical protein
MRILCYYENGKRESIYTGWANALGKLGHDFAFWHPSNKPVFDVFYEYRPDVFIGTTATLTRPLCKCIIANPEIKVILESDVCGNIESELRPEHALSIATAEQKYMVEQLYKKVAKPDFIIYNGNDDFVKTDVLNNWASICNSKLLGILPGADIVQYPLGQYDKNLASDVCYVGNMNEHKLPAINKYLLDTCQPRPKNKVKIFGSKHWPTPYYLGYIDDKDVSNLYYSSTICLDIANQATIDFDLNCSDRPFKILAAGGFCFSNKYTVEEFARLLEVYIEDPEDRRNFLAMRSSLLTNTTYFDRLSVIFPEFEGAKSKCFKELNVCP